MLAAIKNFFDTNLAQSGDTTESEHIDQLQLASAALLIEVMNSDHEQDDREMSAFVSVLRENLHLDVHKLEEVVALAKQEARQSTSLYDFTQLINEHYSYDDKLALMENLWRIAYADGNLDRYEDHLIRKVAELIYVSHSDFIRTKLMIRDNTTDQ